MSNIQITKIKLGKEGKLSYTRALASGKEETCELELLPASPEIEEAAIALITASIKIIGLDEERWAEAQVSGIALKWVDPDNFGATIGLLNKTEYEGEPICHNASTAYLKPEVIDDDLKAKIVAVCVAAIEYIESQPVQLGIEEAIAALPVRELAGVKP